MTSADFWKAPMYLERDSLDTKVSIRDSRTDLPG
jgi:hypothetical protein